ncbi:MAG: GGDEF domain-containing protein [Acidimicrobiales bacterium]
MKAAHRDGIARLARGNPTPLIDSESVAELQACRKDGAELWIELRLAKVTSRDRGQFALAVIRDITIRREAEAAREAAIKELKRLQDELHQPNQQLELISRTDHLTGLWNRRHVEEHLDMALSASRRHDRHLSTLLLDVDDFKGVNSRHGHQIGDVTLREIATRLRDNARAEDTLGRWGGDEFLVVLPDTALTEARAAAERLRVAVAASPVRTRNADIPVTISIGVAGCTTSDKGRVLADADRALSRAKDAGRNRAST